MPGFPSSRIFWLLNLFTLCSGVPFTRQHGELCDWQLPGSCDQSRGLACNYKSQTCTCQDYKTIYSTEKGRCVGRSGEECHLFGGERLCTENAYCLEDQSLSAMPICLCLKGYFKGHAGTCIRKSRYGEFCDTSSKYPSSPSKASTYNGHSCDPDSGLQCVNYVCQCAPGQTYDSSRDLCISFAGMPCSQTLDNCIENAECSEKIWAFDHTTGATKMVGHRCACSPGLKVTADGFCAVEYGGSCNKSSECHPGEGLHCLNNVCQCYPLSQVYDRGQKRCVGLVGSKCQLQQYQKQERYAEILPQSNEKKQQEAKNVILPLVPTSSVSPKPVAVTTSASTSPSPSTSSSTPLASTSASTTPASTTTVIVSSSTTKSSTTPSTPKPGNSTSRNSRSFLYFRLSRQNGDVPEHRGTDPPMPIVSQCVKHAECTESDVSGEYECTCKKGSSETPMRTCLLDYGERCGQHNQKEKNTEKGMSSSPLECNIFEGLVCQSDFETGKSCQCADPALVYDAETKACLSTGPCGKMKLNSQVLLNLFNYNDKESGMPPFYQFQTEQFVTINCMPNATCTDKSVNGQLKQVCMSSWGRGRLSQNKLRFVS